MKKTLQKILKTGLVLCVLNSGLKEPCYAKPLRNWHPLGEPKVVAERVEPYPNAKPIALVTTLSVITLMALAYAGHRGIIRKRYN